MQSVNFVPPRVRANVPPRRDDQRPEQLDGAHPFLAIGAVDGQAGRGRFGRTDALAGLHRGLLITAHARVALLCQRLRLLIEIAHRSRLRHALRLGRMRPRVRAPGVALVLPEPGADRPRRDPRHDLLLDGDLREFFPRPAPPRLAVLTGRATSERRNLGALERSKGARATRTWRILQSVGRLPALAPALDGIDTAVHAAGDLRVPPGGMLMRQQENAGTLDFGLGSRGAGAEVLQVHCLCRGQGDGILGQRSWHDDSPPHQAKVSGIVICQDFAHVKPAAY